MALPTSLLNNRAALAGILPALITPLTEAREVNTPVLERLLARLYAAGADGVYVCGNTGEGTLMAPAMRRKVLETAVRCSAPDKKVIAHVGADAVTDAIALAEHAAGCGVHAISSLPPAGDFDAIRAYYARITSATKLPFLIYYFPDVAPGIRTREQIETLASLPNVIGLKFTDFDLYRLSMLTRAGLTVFNGRDEVLAAGLLMGACGGIGSFYNIVPVCALRVYRAARAGRYDEARRQQDKLNDVISACLKFPLIPALKQVLGWYDLPCGPSLGARELTAGEAAELRTALDALGELA